MARFAFEGEGCFPTGKHYPGIAHLIRIAAAGLIAEFDSQTPTSEMPFVSIDTETTGTDWNNDRVIEVGCVIMQGGVVKAKHSWLINPECKIPEGAFKIHGISDDDVRDKPVFADVVEEIFSAIEHHVPIAYNAEFDQKFLLAEIARVSALPPRRPGAFEKGVRWVDPLVWARHLHAQVKSKSLGAMAELLGVELENAHRATDDAAAAGLVLLELMKDKRVPTSYGAFLQEQNRLARLQAEQRQYWKN